MTESTLFFQILCGGKWCKIRKTIKDGKKSEDFTSGPVFTQIF